MEQAIEALRQGLGKLEEIAQKEFPWTSPESPLEASLHYVAEGDIPVAVLDERRHLLGMITRKALIGAMKPDKPNSEARFVVEAGINHNEKIAAGGQ